MSENICCIERGSLCSSLIKAILFCCCSQLMMCFHNLVISDKGKSSITKEVSTQTEGEEESATCCDVTEKEGLQDRPTGAVPKTKVKACVPTAGMPCVKRPFLQRSTEVKAPEGHHHRPLFVCNSHRASTPIKTRWKRRPKSLWEDTAKTMLDMTVIYLRKLPQVYTLPWIHFRF